MSQSVPRRRGRPRKAASEEERVARERPLQRARSQRYYQRQHQQAIRPHRAPTESQQAEFIHHYHYQPHPPAIPSTTDPVIGLHLEPHLQIPTPFEDPPAAEPTYNRNYDDDEPNEAEACPAGVPYSPLPVGDNELYDTLSQYCPALKNNGVSVARRYRTFSNQLRKTFTSQYHQPKVSIPTPSKRYPESQFGPA
ncbi:hypothetical protein EDB80DRAFT_237456 [Ilyonectria destructans]|nr:hypothetical protein EDB80DRAFT_237456 [Ilyonectria destructans]